MAEERTLGLARATEELAEEPSKEELQRRLGEARDSISHTVTEIKETVANQVQAVKDTLDWREQFKKRPAVWSAGALGVGFVVGYGLASIVKGDRDDYSSSERYARDTKSYIAQPVLRAGVSMPSRAEAESEAGNGLDEGDGPGFFSRLANTSAYERVRDEAGSIGDAFVQELSKTAKQVVLPAVITSLRNFIGGYLPSTRTATSQASATSTSRDQSDRQSSRMGSTYQPTLERNQS
jgi:hypothetical protein